MPGLLDLVDDPNQLGLLSLGLRLMSMPGKFGAALGQAGMGALGDVQQARSALEARKLREQQMRFQQLQEERAAAAEQRLAALAPIQQEAAVLQLRNAQAEEARRQKLADAATASQLSPEQVSMASNGGPTLAAAAAVPMTAPGFNWKAYQGRVAGIDPMMALQIEASLRKDQPKLKNVETMRMPNGNLANIALFEDGTTKVLPYGVKPDMVLQSLGDKVMAIDKNALPSGASLAMGQSPDSVASNKLGWANFGLARDRLNFDQTQPKNQYDADRGVLVDTRTGTATPVMQGGQPLGGKQKDLTDAQSKALLFGTRALESNSILAGLAKDGVDRPGAIKSILESAPLVGDGLGAIANVAPTWAGGPNAQQQQVEQAQRDFINAVLRRESGAVISPDEFANARKQYFPQAGDSEEVRAQKKRNRETAVQGILQEVPDGRRPTPRAADPQTPTPTKRWNPSTNKFEPVGG